MKITKAQAESVAYLYAQEANEKIRKEVDRIEKLRWTAWGKTAEGKLFAKLPKWMQPGGYEVHRSESWASATKGLPKVPEMLRGRIIEPVVYVLSIDANTVDELKTSLKKHFSVRP